MALDFNFYEHTDEDLRYLHSQLSIYFDDCSEFEARDLGELERIRFVEKIKHVTNEEFREIRRRIGPILDKYENR